MIMKKIFTVYHFIQLFLCGLEPLSRPTESQNSTLIITDNMLVSITNKGVGVLF